MKFLFKTMLINFTAIVLNIIIGSYSFTIDELKAINYEVEILQTPKKKEDISIPVVHMTSIFGQEYQCILPQIEEEEVSEKVHFNEKNTDIKELLKPMYNGNCLLKAKDWWTYELCFGQYIKQFHIEDGQVIGQVLTLGLYDSDYDWNNETNQEKFKHAKQRYHSQYYINGTKCDLTGQPRVAEIRIFCEEDSGDYIHRVDEPGTCSYVIAVHTSRVCSHPQLKPLPSKKAHTIPCHPLLNEEQYNKYSEKLNEEKALADQKRSQWLNNQQQRLQNMKNENSLNAESDEVRDFKEFYKNFIEDQQNDFNLNDLAVNKLEKNKEKASKSKENLKDESITDETEENAQDDDEDAELEKLKSFFSPEKFAAVKSNIQKFSEILLNEAEEDEDSELSEENKNNAHEKFILSLLRKLEKDASNNINKIPKLDTDDSDEPENEVSELEMKNNKKSLNEESLLNGEEENENDDLQVRIRRIERVQYSGKVYELDKLQQKKLEQAIKEKLEKFGLYTGRRIEVKIIKAGSYDSHLTDEEASQFENMITALLTGEREAIQEMERNKKLEENYKFSWDDDIEEEEEE